MLSLEVQQSLDSFLRQRFEFSPLLEALESIAGFYEASNQYILGQANGGDKLNQSSGALQSRFASLHILTREIAPRKVYGAFEALKSAIAEDLDTELAEDKFFQAFRQGIERFIELYDAYLMTQSPENAANLMLESSKINERVKLVLDALTFFVNSNRSSGVAAQSETEVSLVLFHVESLNDYIAKLSAFRNLYSELCLLLGTTEGSHPLRILKIESGSLWIRVFGDTRVTQLLTGILESTIGFLHRRYTSEGKIAAVPSKLESLDAAIQVSARLKSLGVDTDAMNENLRKGGVAISESLAELLEGQPRVRLNDQLHTVGYGLETPLLAQKTRLQLPDESGRIEPKLLENDTSPPGTS
jgi:hypothetical protein